MKTFLVTAAVEIEAESLLAAVAIVGGKLCRTREGMTDAYLTALHTASREHPFRIVESDVLAAEETDHA